MGELKDCLCLRKPGSGSPLLTMEFKNKPQCQVHCCPVIAKEETVTSIQLVWQAGRWSGGVRAHGAESGVEMSQGVGRVSPSENHCPALGLCASV